MAEYTSQLIGVQWHLVAEPCRDDNSDAPGSPFWDPGAVLTTREVESFVADGFVAIRGAVPGDVVTACQDVIWAELGKLGVAEDPASWAEPVVRIPCPEGGPFVDAGTRPVVWEACDQLIGGTGRW